MKLNSEQKEIVELFVKQELIIKRLYILFSRRYLEYKAFWEGMAKEEHEHAAMIQRIYEHDSTDMFEFTQGDLRSSSLNSSMKFLEGLISEFQSDKEFPITKAVSIALHLEKALWERKVFQYFEGDSEEVKRIMNTLNLEQELHIKKLDKFAWQIEETNRLKE